MPAAPGSKHLWFLAATGLLMIVAALLAGLVAERRALNRALEEMRTSAQLRAALLASEIERFRLLPLALSGDRDVGLALGADPAARQALNRKLERMAQATGAPVIYVLDPQGRAIAASNFRSPDSFVGQNYAFRPYFTQARESGLGSQYALGTISSKPGLYLSRSTPDGGVIVVKLEFDRIERQWTHAEGLTLVENASNIVLVTSEPAFRFAVHQADAPGAASSGNDLRQETGELSRFLSTAKPMLSVSVPTTVEDWRLVLLMPRNAALGGAVAGARIAAAALVLAFAGAAAVLLGRARRLREARQSQAARTAELEAAVSARTVELRREMEVRLASEARAAELREGLRQANRLATLGQVTASVAHETAQPVAAIRTYAENGARLLDRNDADEARGNFEAIGRLADRIGAVTAQLRGFARKGTGSIGPLPLDQAIDGALLILKERLRGIDVEIESGPGDLRVLAGRVRLEQVLVNLLQNAAEALEETAGAQVRVSVKPRDDTIRLVVADNGPGIAPELADRLFTPFTTSRASGLGLGLVIAQDIVHDLGGTLRLLPQQSGAAFELVLRRAP